MVVSRMFRQCVAVAAACIAFFLLASCGGGGSSKRSVSASLTVSSSDISVGQSVLINWSSANATSCQASGSDEWSGSVDLSGSKSLTPTATGSLNLVLTCTGARGSASASATITVNAVNVATIVVDKGPAGNGINLPFTSVTVCRPGTNTCQTIDHVLVDTGSYGLRIIGPGVIDSSLALPSVKNASGNALGECAQFVSGFVWGSVNSADVKIAGETALSVPIEIIGNSNAEFTNIPSDCSGTGANLGAIATLGAKGILGVGLFKEDCGATCVSQVVPGTYYECTGTACSATTAPLDKQVVNPVAFFTENNNGVAIEFPSVPIGGAATLAGKLIFGIGTQSNNQLTGKTVYRTDTSGNFNTIYKGNLYSSSFLDSGSNGLFFPDNSIASCAISTDFYCPASPLTLSAVNSASDNSAFGTINFTVESVDKLGNGIVAASIGGNTALFGLSGFDWGLPFFFGRTVFVAMENANTPSGTGPFWAY